MGPSGTPRRWVLDLSCGHRATVEAVDLPRLFAVRRCHCGTVHIEGFREERT